MKTTREMVSNMIKIVIDPGHYKDCPNRGQNGYNEGNAMYQLSQYLKDELTRHGFTVTLTRDKITNPSLYDRGLLAGKQSVDLFISEHSNANDRNTRGVEVFYSVDIPTDVTLARNLSKAVANLMGNPNRGAKIKESDKYPGEDYYGVIDSAQDNGVKHVILVENGFHDNVIDEAFLLKDENLKLIARTQAKVICEFFGVAYVDQVIPQINIDVDVLAGAGIIASPEYWKDSVEYKTEYVQSLIHKVSRYIKGTKTRVD